jgi:hypothetical protein
MAAAISQLDKAAGWATSFVYEQVVLSQCKLRTTRADD